MKNKKIIVFIALIIIAGIAVLFSLLRNNGSNNNAISSELPADDLRKFDNTENLDIKGKSGIVRVSNFLEKAQSIDKEQSLIFMDKDISVTYNSTESTFYIAVDSLDPNKDNLNIERGESYLLSVLNVEKNVLCGLNVIIIQVTSLSEPIQARQYPPSFCEEEEGPNGLEQEKINIR